MNNQYKSSSSSILNSLKERSSNQEQTGFYLGQQPSPLVQFLEDWISKLIKDGYNIERFLEIIKENINNKNKQWLLRYLLSSRNNLRKRNQRPRVCLPRMFVNKSQEQVRSILQKNYATLLSNDTALNYIMRTGYKWRDLPYSKMIQQLKGNRIQVIKLQRISQNYPYTSCLDGIIYRNKNMKQSFDAYGDSLYLFEFSQRIFSNKMSTKWKRFTLGVCLTQFVLPVIVFIAVYDVFVGEDLQNVEQCKKQQQKINLGDIQNGLLIEQDIGNWIQNNRPQNIIYYKHSEYSVFTTHSTYISKLYRNQINGYHVITVWLSNKQSLNKQFQVDIPKIWIGLYTNCDHSITPITMIYDLIHQSISNKGQILIWRLLGDYRDNCQLVTVLLKLGQCLYKEQRTRCEPAAEVFWSSHHTDLRVDAELKKLRKIVCAKPVLKIIFAILKQAIHYRIQKVSQTEYKVFRKNNDAQIDQRKVIFNLKHECWECQCNYLYQTGLPCYHITVLVLNFNGDISYYVNQRWKHSKPWQTPQIPPRNEAKKNPQTKNKGLLRLLSLYRSYNYGYLF